MTVTEPYASSSNTSRFEEVYASLDDQEKQMFAALQQDAAQAEKLNMPFLGLISRRGQHHFVILRESCDFEKDYKKTRRHRSHLALNETSDATFEKLSKLMSLLKLSGYRANGLEMHRECLRHGPDSTYFEYHIDLEAAA